ncbi:topoisomerase DNA-binding C4 zinc finger domain-containing protein [Candidatus Micrarchaeota archaeon]|nr:topoisomerase DNA-binding C4 zinc finger domain-containing protein [Candidatus Micrarchaeota archaeon]
MRVEALLGKETFFTTGSRTIEPGWIKFFSPYARFSETQLPAWKKGDGVSAEKIELLEKQTQPPKRFSQASIIKKLEELGIGTKATRAEILQTLYDRNYITGKKSIEVTDFGQSVHGALAHNVPEILSETLTKKFEEELGLVESGKKQQEQVVEEGKQILTSVLAEFSKKQSDIGVKLKAAANETRRVESTLGGCKCGNGQLAIKRSKFGQFVGCTAYPNCKQTYPLPRDALIKPSDKACEKCGTPIITVIRKDKRPWNMCMDPACETKKTWANTNYSKKGV